MCGRSTGCKEGVVGDGMEKYHGVRARRASRGTVRSLCWIQFQGKVTSLLKPELALPLLSRSGCRPRRRACGRNWQTSRLAAPPGLFLHQETRFPVTQTMNQHFLCQ